MITLSFIVCMFTMRPLSVTFYLYVIAHQIKTVHFAYDLFEDEEDDYPWTLY